MGVLGWLGDHFGPPAPPDIPGSKPNGTSASIGDIPIVGPIVQNGLDTLSNKNPSGLTDAEKASQEANRQKTAAYTQGLINDAASFVPAKAPVANIGSTERTAAAQKKYDDAQAALAALSSRQYPPGPQGAAAAAGDYATARHFVDAAKAELAAAQTAPTTQVTATTYDAPTSDFVSGLTAGTVSAPGQITTNAITAPGATAGHAGQAAPVTATQFAAPTNDFVSGLTAGTVGAPDRVSAGAIGNQNTGDQRNALAMAKGAADGTAPSAAQWLLQKGIDENVGTAYGLAASLQGRNSGQALQQGSRTAMNAIAKSAADAAALRATEQATGREQYAGIANTMAGQNIDVSKANQLTELNTSINNVKNAIDVATGNRDAALKAGMQADAEKYGAEIENQRSQLASLQSNQTALLEASKATATNTTNTNITNATLDTNTNIANQIAQLDASKATEANALAAQAKNIENQIAVETSNRDAALKAGLQADAEAYGKSIAELSAKAEALKNNQSALLEAAKATASNNVTIADADAERAVKTLGLNYQQIDQLKSMGLSGLIAQLSADQAQAKVASDQAASNQAFWGSAFGAAGKVITGK